MPEITDTNNEIYPAGPAKLKATKPAVKKLTPAGKAFYIFEFEGIVDGTIMRHSEVIFPWKCADLLRAFGFKEGKPGVFEWEKDSVVDKEISCVIIHEPDYKDKSITRARITEAKEEIPF